MKKYLYVGLVATLVVSCTISKRTTYLSTPHEKGSSFKPVNVDSILAKYSGYDGVFLDVERAIEHFGKVSISLEEFLFNRPTSPWSYCDVARYRYIVLNPEASQLTQVSFPSIPDKLYIVITNPDSTVRRYGLPQLREETEEGEIVHRLIFPKILRGSLIEIGSDYTRSGKRGIPALDHDITLQFNVPCEKLSFSYAYPDWWQIQIKDTGPYSKVQYERAFDADNRKALLRYAATDIPAIPEEPYSPYFKEVSKSLRFHVVSLSSDSSESDPHLTWEEMAKAMHEVLIKPAGRGKGRFDIDNLARKFTRADTSRYNVLQTAVNYVRDSMEISSHRSKTDYHRVARQRKGGLMELLGLLRAVLAKLEIPADLLLIHSAKDGFLDDNYNDLAEYSVPAIKTEIDGEPCVLFPYGEALPLGYIPEPVQGQPALTIHEDGRWEFWTVPPTTRDDNTTMRAYRVILSGEGNVSIEETGTLKGFAAYAIRKELARLTDTELEKKFNEFATFSGAHVTLRSHEVENLDDPEAPLVLKLSYDISNLLTITPEEVIFHTGGLFAPISGSKKNFDPDYRQLPISIRADEQHDKNIEISFPPNWHLTTALTDVSMENVFGSINSQYLIGDGELRVTQKISLNQMFADREQYPGLLELVGNRSLQYLPNLVFSVSDMAP